MTRPVLVVESSAQSSNQSVEEQTSTGFLTSVTRVQLVAMNLDGDLKIRSDAGAIWSCDVLSTCPAGSLCVGDTLLVLPPSSTNGRGVVLGKVVRYGGESLAANVHLEATESLTLKCGEASVELRADGRAMIKGEDVLLRAKGTQRIRAGNVAIN